MMPMYRLNVRCCCQPEKILGTMDLLRIPGGWLYRTRISNGNREPNSLALTFVPDNRWVKADDRQKD